MAFKWIENNNIFWLPAFIFGGLLFARVWFQKRPGPWRTRFQALSPRAWLIITILFLISCLLIPIFEAYFVIFSCQVSQNYYSQNVQLARDVMGLLQKNHVPVWLDFATLLCQLRSQEINPWDHDVDLSVIHPAHMASLATLQIHQNKVWAQSVVDALKTPEGTPPDSVDGLLRLLKENGFPATWDEKRLLIQVFGPRQKGPHIDLWLWTAVPAGAPFTEVAAAEQFTTSAPPVFWTGDMTVDYNPRKYTDLFPLTPARWLGVDVFIPRDSHEVSRMEFDRYGGSYMVAQVFRGDCFHNFFNLRFLY